MLIMNNYPECNLRLTRVVTLGSMIYYEIENSKHEKRYFIHRGFQSVILDPDNEDICIVDNETVVRELKGCHNESVAHIIMDGSNFYRFISLKIDDLYIVVVNDEEDVIWNWIKR